MALVFFSFPLARLAERLAGIARRDEINGLKARSVDMPDVAIFGYAGPVFRQHLPAVVIDLDLPLANHPRALEAQVEAADAREQTAEGHCALLLLSAPVPLPDPVHIVFGFVSAPSSRKPTLQPFFIVIA
jgi:hypothetical protein